MRSVEVEKWDNDDEFTFCAFVRLHRPVPMDPGILNHEYSWKLSLAPPIGHGKTQSRVRNGKRKSGENEKSNFELRTDWVNKILFKS